MIMTQITMLTQQYQRFSQLEMSTKYQYLNVITNLIPTCRFFDTLIVVDNIDTHLCTGPTYNSTYVRLKLANLKVMKLELERERERIIVYEHASHKTHYLHVITNLISLGRFFNITIDVGL